MNEGNQALAKAILNATNLAPSEKRKAVLDLGARVSYKPHQGKREMARRVKKLGQKSNG